MRARSYALVGLDVLGVDDDYGPLSPEQLSRLDRKLTSAEQKAVDDWQASQARQAQAAEEKKGGPTASATIAPGGATVTENRPAKGWSQPQPDKMGPAITPNAAVSSKPLDWRAPALVGGLFLFGGAAGAALLRSNRLLGAFVGGALGGGAGAGVAFSQGYLGGKKR